MPHMKWHNGHVIPFLVRHSAAPPGRFVNYNDLFVTETFLSFPATQRSIDNAVKDSDGRDPEDQCQQQA